MPKIIKTRPCLSKLQLAKVGAFFETQHRSDINMKILQSISLSISILCLLLSGFSAHPVYIGPNTSRQVEDVHSVQMLTELNCWADFRTTAMFALDKHDELVERRLHTVNKSPDWPNAAAVTVATTTSSLCDSVTVLQVTCTSCARGDTICPAAVRRTLRPSCSPSLTPAAPSAPCIQ